MQIIKKIIHYLCFSPLRTFVIISSIFGLLIIVFSLPLTGADEEAHFTRAYGISSGDLRLYDTKKVNVPTSFRQTLGCFQTGKNLPGEMYTYDYSKYGDNHIEKFICSIKTPLNKSELEQVDTTAQSYSPTSYIPQAIAISIGKVLNLPIVVMIYMTRIFVMMSYILMISLAISLLPIRKWALVGVALLPLPFLNLSNPGADYLIYGLTSIILAVVIRSILIKKSSLQRQNYLLLTILAISSALIIATKSIFPGILIVPLVIFFGGIRHSFLPKVLIILFSLTIGFIWQVFGINMEIVTVGMGTNSIFSFPAAFIETMYTRWVDTDFIYYGDRVGNIPDATNRIGMPALIVTLINILLAIYIFVGYPSEKSILQISKRQLNIFISICILSAIGIIVGSFASIFVGAAGMQSANEAIRGVQTRYLFSSYFILATLPFTRKIFVQKENDIAKIVVFGSIICLSSTLLMVILDNKWFFSLL